MIKKMVLATCAVALMMVSCSEDDNNTTKLGGEGNILITNTIKNPDGMSGSTYIQLIEKFSGSVDNSNALSIGFNTIPFVSGNEIYTFPDFGPTSTNKVDKYVKEDNGLKKIASLDVPVNSIPFSITVLNKDKAYLPLLGLGKVFVVNPKTMTKISEIDLTSYAHNDNNPEPSLCFIRGNYCYVTLNQVDPKFQPYKDHMQTDVAVINIKTDKVEKIISETATGLAFPTRPYFKDMIFTNEQNDIYIATLGYFGFAPVSNGFACIPNGKTEFDVSKSWDISNTTIEGTTYKSASVLNTKYIGNGKIAAFVAIYELIDSDKPMSSHNSMAVIIDLNTQTIKQVKDIPLSSNHSVFLDKIDGKVVFGAYGKGKKGFFTYNIKNKEVKHVLTTVGDPTFMHSFK